MASSRCDLREFATWIVVSGCARPAETMTEPRSSCSRTAGPSAGEAYGAAGETFGEAVFATGMTGYQETLTDPSLSPAGRGADRAAHRQHRRQRRGSASRGRIWVAGYVVRDPRRGPVNWRSHRQPRRRAGRTGHRRHQRHRHPGADPAPARARRDAGRHLQRRCSIADALLERVLASPGCRRRPRRRGLAPPSRTSSPPTGEQRFTVAALDLGIKAHDPAPDGRARHATCTSCRRRRPPRTCSPTEPDGVFFSNGPGDPATADGAGRRCCRACSARRAVLRDLLRQPAARPGARASAPTSCGYGHRGINQPVQDRATGQGRDHRPQPRLRRRRAARRVDARPPFGAVEVSHVGLNDDVVEGLGCLDVPAFSVQYHPEAAAGSARRGLPVRPVRRPDGRAAADDAASRPTSAASWSSAPARS